MKKLWFFIFYLCPMNLWAAIHLAILDTGFCPSKIKAQKNIKIENPIDLTASMKQDYCQKMKLNLPRFHGQLVLQNLVNFLDHTKEEIIITPLIIFDSKGKQHESYWQRALSRKYDVVVSAAGLVTKETKFLPLTGIWFVAAPRVGPGITRESGVFPANQAPLTNLFLIGNFIEGKPILFDEGQLYQDKIDYFFSKGKGELTGTSRAVTEGAARGLNFCMQELHTSFRECLKKKSFDVNGMRSY